MFHQRDDYVPGGALTLFEEDTFLLSTLDARRYPCGPCTIGYRPELSPTVFLQVQLFSGRCVV
jgi:hypothetical protein